MGSRASPHRKTSKDKKTAYWRFITFSLNHIGRKYFFFWGGGGGSRLRQKVGREKFAIPRTLHLMGGTQAPDPRIFDPVHEGSDRAKPCPETVRRRTRHVRCDTGRRQAFTERVNRSAEHVHTCAEEETSCTPDARTATDRGPSRTGSVKSRQPDSGFWLLVFSPLGIIAMISPVGDSAPRLSRYCNLLVRRGDLTTAAPPVRSARLSAVHCQLRPPADL